MASRSVNKVILIGNLGKDAESKFTPNGTSVATFSIATSWRQKDQQTGEWKDHTDWHNIVLWRAENVAPYLLKGTQVFIEGRLQTRNYENKEGRSDPALLGTVYRIEDEDLTNLATGIVRARLSSESRTVFSEPLPANVSNSACSCAIR